MTIVHSLSFSSRNKLDSKIVYVKQVYTITRAYSDLNKVMQVDYLSANEDGLSSISQFPPFGDFFNEPRMAYVFDNLEDAQIALFTLQELSRVEAQTCTASRAWPQVLIDSHMQKVASLAHQLGYDPRTPPTYKIHRTIS